MRLTKLNLDDMSLRLDMKPWTVTVLFSWNPPAVVWAGALTVPTNHHERLTLLWMGFGYITYNNL